MLAPHGLRLGIGVRLTQLVSVGGRDDDEKRQNLDKVAHEPTRRLFAFEFHQWFITPFQQRGNSRADQFCCSQERSWLGFVLDGSEICAPVSRDLKQYAERPLIGDAPQLESGVCADRGKKDRAARE